LKTVVIAMVVSLAVEARDEARAKAWNLVERPKR